MDVKKKNAIVTFAYYLIKWRKLNGEFYLDFDAKKKIRARKVD